MHLADHSVRLVRHRLVQLVRHRLAVWALRWRHSQGSVRVWRGVWRIRRAGVRAIVVAPLTVQRGHDLIEPLNADNQRCDAAVLYDGRGWVTSLPSMRAVLL